MAGNVLLSIVLIAFLGGCSNLTTATPPDRVLAGIHGFGTTALAYTADGQRFISVGLRGELRVWDAASQSQHSEARARHGAVRAILPLSSDDLLAAERMGG
jgi:hypothetical protein